MKNIKNYDNIGLDPFISDSRYLAAIEGFSTAESIKQLLERGFKNASIKFGSYHHIPAIGADNYDKLNRYFAFNMPEFVTDYFDKGPSQDTGIRHVFETAKPIWLSDMVASPSINAGKHKTLVEYAFNITGDALLIPLFGPFHRRGYVIIGFEKPKAGYDEIFAWQVESLFQAFHIRYCTLIDSFRETARLTERESEVLELVTFGKTNPEIGVILGISSNTVNGYVKRIFLKLNAQDRVTATLRSRTSKLIS